MKFLLLFITMFTPGMEVLFFESITLPFISKVCAKPTEVIKKKDNNGRK